MEWTRKVPSGEGFYYRKGADGRVEIVEIRRINERLKIFINLVVSYPMPTGSLWAGPIPEPEGD